MLIKNVAFVKASLLRHGLAADADSMMEWLGKWDAFVAPAVTLLSGQCL
jgi:hypothetical protein